MPNKDLDLRRATNRQTYARNREKYIKAVAERKRTSYQGTCRNCGGPTIGSSKNNIPEWCGKPECKSAQHKGNPIFVKSGKLGKEIQMVRRRWAEPKKKIAEASLDDILHEMKNKKQRRKVG